MTREPRWKCADAAQAQKTIVPAGIEAEIAVRLEQALGMGLICRDVTQHNIGVTAYVFGRRLDRKIDAMDNRGKEDRRRPGIVEKDRRSPFMCGLRNCRHVLDLEGQ